MRNVAKKIELSTSLKPLFFLEYKIMYYQWPLLLALEPCRMFKITLDGKEQKINPDKSHSQGYPGNAFHYFTNLSGGKKMGPYAVEGILNV